MPAAPQTTLSTPKEKVEPVVTAEAQADSLGMTEPLVEEEATAGMSVPLVFSDHKDLPSGYWTEEEYGHPEYVEEFWKAWTAQPKMSAPVEEDERTTNQQAFAQTFMADKQPDFFRALNVFQRAFDVKIQRSLNGFVKFTCPKVATFKGFFHVPHPASDIGRDAMWAREIHRCLVEMGLGRAE